MKFMELMPADSEFVKNLHKKLAPPLVTLLSSEAEVRVQLHLFDKRSCQCLPLWTQENRSGGGGVV